MNKKNQALVIFDWISHCTVYSSAGRCFRRYAFLYRRFAVLGGFGDGGHTD